MKKVVGLMFIVSLCTFFLCGCTGVEAEKRAYPQVIAVDRDAQNYQLMLGMPNMQAATGQEKSGDSNQASTLKFEGKNMQQINKMYNETQEKYMDLGHVKILILGKGMLQGDLWEQVLSSLKQEPTIGEDIYVFATEDIQAVMDYNGNQTDSLGDYLVGIYENRPYSMREKGVTLRQVYKTWYEDCELCPLPVLRIQQQGYLQVID